MARITNVSHRLMNVNACYPIVGTIWGGGGTFKSWSLVIRCHWESMKVPSHVLFPVYTFCLICVGRDIISHLLILDT